MSTVPLTASDVFRQSQWSADLHSFASTVSLAVPQSLVKLTFKIPSDTLPLKLGPVSTHITLLLVINDSKCLTRTQSKYQKENPSPMKPCITKPI